MVQQVQLVQPKQESQMVQQTLKGVQACSLPQQTLKMVQAFSLPQQALKVVQASSALLPQVPMRQTPSQTQVPLFTTGYLSRTNTGNLKLMKLSLVLCGRP